MREAVGVAVVVAALVPLTFRAAFEGVLDRVHRNNTGRAATNKRRRLFQRSLLFTATVLAVAGALVVSGVGVTVAL